MMSQMREMELQLTQKTNNLQLKINKEARKV